METYLFAGVSFATVLIYYAIASKLNFSQFRITSIETAYWNAFQTFMWTLGAVAFRNSPPPSILASAAVLPTAIIYGLIAEQPGMAFSLQNKSFSTTQIIVLVFVSIAVLIHFIITFMKCDMITLILKLLPLVSFIIWIVNWIPVNKASSLIESTPPQYYDKTETKLEENYTQTIISYSFYFHHWMIALAAFLATVTDDTYSQIISGIFWGIFCQEAGSYGIMIPSSMHVNYT